MRCYFLKPLASIIAVFLLICGLIAPAFAAECTVCDANVRLSDTAGTISANGTTVTATAYGAKKSEQTNTITLTNDSSSDANISFTWSATRSNSLCSYSCNVDGDTNKSGTFSKNLLAGESVTLTIYAKGGNLTTNTATLTLSNISYTPVSSTYAVAISHSNGGSVTVDGATVTSGTSYDISPTAGATLKATSNSGYTFLGWIDSNGVRLSSNASYTVTPTTDMSITAVFAGSDTAWFLVDNTYLVDNLTTAGSKGTKIVLMNNGTLTGSHTIASGDTLLIPFDDAHTVYTTKPGDDGGDMYVATSKYRELTMASGASITVNGAISIGGKIGTNMTGEVVDTKYYFTNGAPSGPLGYIAMNSDSSITVNSGGNLYVWGFITGSGDVTIKSGGNVYEDLQIRDYRGGNCTTAVLRGKDDYEVFPFSQYYIQNVECPLTLESGATQNVCTAVSYSILIDTWVSKENAVFLGSNSGLIRLSSGELTRRYDSSADRIIYELDGDISFANLSITITVAAGNGITINSQDFVMPLTNNMTLIINSGSNVALNQDFAILPGAIVEIKDDATVTMGTGKRIIAYDYEQWGGYCGAQFNKKLVPVYFAPGRTGTRTESSLVDAKIIVDGTLDATSGYLYTTSNGANITSNGGGVVKAAKGSETVTYQITQTGNTVEAWNEIGITPAQLLNNNGTYTQTGKSTTNPNTFTYTNGKWVCAVHSDAEETVNICDACGTALVAQTQSDKVKYASLAEAVGKCGEGDCIQMLADSTAAAIIDRAVLIDLAGCNVSGVTIKTGVKFMDSSTNGYGDAKGVLTAALAENGSIAPITKYDPDGESGTIAPKQYVKIANGNTYTFPRVAVSVTGIQFYKSGESYDAIFRGGYKGAGPVPDAVGFDFTNTDQSNISVTNPDDKSTMMSNEFEFFYGKDAVQSVSKVNAAATVNGQYISSIKRDVAALLETFPKE